LWDQNSFDPAYETLPLDFFRPMVGRVFARRAYDSAHVQPGLRVALVNDELAQARLAEDRQP
jgi:predicted HD phosphohydrolase